MENPARPLAQAILHLWRLARPEVWMVSIFPGYVGWVLASRQLLPAFGVWTAFWDRAASRGATFGDFADTVATWMPQAWKPALAALVAGPILWAATLLVNDVYDLPGDRLNPRKARSPLVQGIVSRGWALRGAYLAAALTLGLSAVVGPGFVIPMAACLALAWAYSVPPVRLKTRPGADILVNAVGIGFLSALAGWAIARPLADFPYAFVPQGLLVATAVYVPTTLVDREADAAAGYLTIATHLGERRAYRIGWWSWVGCNLGALVLSWNDLVIPRAMFPLLLIFVPVLLYEYHAFIGRAGSAAERIKGILVCSLTFAAVNMVFALMYTGLWRAA